MIDEATSAEASRELKTPDLRALGLLEGYAITREPTHSQGNADGHPKSGIM
ncbi:MAG TPA: hypothetical protein VJ023_13980 [Pyrinomonadaceae bacterium]|nr:hypothetical protein [Pyrinomonadaceae bacterium]